MDGLIPNYNGGNKTLASSKKLVFMHNPKYPQIKPTSQSMKRILEGCSSHGSTVWPGTPFNGGGVTNTSMVSTMAQNTRTQLPAVAIQNEEPQGEVQLDPPPPIAAVGTGNERTSQQNGTIAVSVEPNNTNESNHASLAPVVAIKASVATTGAIEESRTTETITSSGVTESIVERRAEASFVKEANEADDSSDDHEEDDNSIDPDNIIEVDDENVEHQLAGASQEMMSVESKRHKSKKLLALAKKELMISSGFSVKKVCIKEMECKVH